MNTNIIHQRRSLCLISFSLETVGDLWSLLIVQLEQKGMLPKKPHLTDGRKDVYELTEKDLDLIPILLDRAQWGAKHEPEMAGSEAWLQPATIS